MKSIARHMDVQTKTDYCVYIHAFSMCEFFLFVLRPILNSLERAHAHLIYCKNTFSGFVIFVFLSCKTINKIKRTTPKLYWYQFLFFALFLKFYCNGPLLNDWETTTLITREQQQVQIEKKKWFQVKNHLFEIFKISKLTMWLESL